MYDKEKLNNQDDSTYQLQQDDEYGLPEAEYSPLEPIQTQQDKYEEEEPVRPKKEIDLQPQKSSRSSWPIWVGILALLAVAGFALYYFVLNKPKEQIVVPVVAQPQPEPAPEIIEEAPVEEWVPPVKEEGSVTTISGKTGRYYIVVGSFIDGDMAADYAKKLANEGRQVTLIEPTGNKKFYRLGVVDAESFAAANEKLDELKATFGQEIWIVRY